MTFECGDLAAVTAALRGLAARKARLRVTAVKNRLMAEFDVATTGGYRDMLVNCCHVATGHLCEVRTLSSMATV